MPRSFNCNKCSAIFKGDQNCTTPWKLHVKESHPNEDFRTLCEALPSNWKRLVKCEKCNAIVTDSYLPVTNHAQACANPYTHNVSNYKLKRDLFPHSILPAHVLDQSIVQLAKQKRVLDASSAHAGVNSDHESNEDEDSREHTTTQTDAPDSPIDQIDSSIDSFESYHTPRTSFSSPNRYADLAEEHDVEMDEEEDEEEEEEEEEEDPFVSTSRRYNASKSNSDINPNLSIPNRNSRSDINRNPKPAAPRKTTKRARLNPIARNPARRTVHYTAAPAPHPDLLNEARLNLAYTEDPTPEQTEALTALISDLSDGAFNLQNGHINDMQLLTDKLLTLSRSDDPCQNELALAAWQLVPGLYTRLQKKKQPRLHEKLREWTQHESTHLEVIMAAQLLLQHKSTNNQAAPSNKLSHDRAAELVKAGRMGALMRAIEQESGTGPVRQSTADMTLLAAPLHPQSDDLDDFADLTMPETVNPVSFNVYELAKSITTLPEISASGASAWTFKILRQLYRKEAYALLHNSPRGQNPNEDNQNNNEPPTKGIGLLHDLYHRLLTRRLAPRTMSRLLMSRLILLPKPNGGTRPIAIGDSILRLMLRVINTKVAKEVGKLIEPTQVAVGTSGGCEIIASLVQFTLNKGSDYLDNSDDPDSHRAAWLLDLPNAFNKVNRRSIAIGIQRYCPELLDLFAITYGRQSELRAHTADGRGQLIGHSMKGCRQGDPLSMLYFSVALQPALLQIQELLLTEHGQMPYEPTTIAYADDIALCGNASIIRNCMSRINNFIVQATGISLNLKKCKVIGRGTTTLAMPSSLAGTTFSETGGEIVGVPVGTTQHRLELTTALIAEQATSLDLITANRAIDEQTKLSLIINCANMKPPYLCRNVPPDISNAPLQAFDDKTDAALSAIAGTPLSDTAKILRGLPIGLGGCGIRRHAGMHSINDFNKCNNLVAEFASRHLPELHEALAAQPALPLTPTPQEEETPAADIQGLCKIQHQDLLERTVEGGTELGAQHQAHIRSGTMTGTCTYTASGNWLRWMGGADQRLRMKPEILTNALRTRLCLPVCNEHLACPNANIHAERHQDEPVDLHTTFMHTVLCQPAAGVSGAIKRRHDYVRDALKDLIRDTGFANTASPPRDALDIERKVGENGANEIAADILWIDARGTARQHRYVIDVTIVEACGRDGTAKETGNAARLAAISKLATYAAVGNEPHTSIVPFALESAGHIGTHATEFLMLLAERDPSNPSRIAQFLTFISYVIAKHTATASEAGRMSAVANRSQ